MIELRFLQIFHHQFPRLLFIKFFSATAQLLYTMMISRLLEPSSFGIVAIAQAWLLAPGLMFKLGISLQTIRARGKVSDEAGIQHLSRLSAGSFFLLGCASSAFLKFALRNDSLSICFLFVGWSIAAQIFSEPYLGRALASGRMVRLGSIQLMAFILISFSVVLPFAYRGYGVMSLLLGLLITSTVNAGISWWVVKDLRSPKFSNHKVRPSLIFGFKYGLTATLDSLSTTLDNMLIGATMGAQSVGVYSRFSLVSALPLQLVSEAANQIFLPRYASKSKQQTAISASKVIIVLIVISGLVCSHIILWREFIIEALLGSQWTSWTSLLTVLPLGCFANYIAAQCLATLDAHGAIGLRLRINISQVFLLSVSMVFAVTSRDLLIVAWVWALCEAIRLLQSFIAMFRLLRPTRAAKSLAWRAVSWSAIVFSFAEVAPFTTKIVAAHHLNGAAAVGVSELQLLAAAAIGVSVLKLHHSIQNQD